MYALSSSVFACVLFLRLEAKQYIVSRSVLQFGVAVRWFTVLPAI